MKSQDQKESLELVIGQLKAVNQNLMGENKELNLERQILLFSNESLEVKAEALNAEILQIQEMQKIVQQSTCRHNYPEWTLPETSGFISTKNYYESKSFLW